MVDGEFYQANCYVRETSLAATYEYVDAVKSEYTYYLQNAHGDVVNLTDSSGAVVKTYKYDAFGVEKNISDNDTNAFRYCGEYYDSETGTIYLRARYYNPSTGRFTQRDSFAGSLGVPLSLNLYTYCHNNPILYFDPSGHGIGDFYVNIYSYWESGIKDMQSRGMAFKCAASWAKGNMDAIGSKVVGVVDGVSNFVKDPFDTITSAGMNATISMLRPDIKIQQQMQRIKETSLLEELFYISGQTNAQIAEIGIAYTGGEALSMFKSGLSAKPLTGGKSQVNSPNPNTQVVRNPEVKSSSQIKANKVTDYWDEYLGKNQTDIHPIKGISDPDRIFSFDGTKSIRFGNHEMNSIDTSKFHFHEERWIYNAQNDVMNYFNTLIRIKE